jgi:hypothetical protein
VAAVFFAGFPALRFAALGQGKHPGALLVPTNAWILYATWEWQVMVRTPEANIRFDLMVIWPALLIPTMWFTVRALRSEGRPVA